MKKSDTNEVWFWAAAAPDAKDIFWLFKDGRELDQLEARSGQSLSWNSLKVDTKNPAPALLECVSIAHTYGVNWNRMLFQMTKVPEFRNAMREFNPHFLISNPVGLAPREPARYDAKLAQQLADILGLTT